MAVSGFGLAVGRYWITIPRLYRFTRVRG